MNVWVDPVVMTRDDQSIIDTVYAITDPRSLPDLLPRVPVGIDVVDVEAVYDVAAANRQQYIDCAACNRKINHTHGFVLRFANGKRATIGRTCADKRHQLEYERYLSAFDDKRSRVRLLRQALAMHATASDLRACLDQLKATDITALRALRKRFRDQYRDVAVELEKYPDGTIIGLVQKRDLEGERARDKRRERKIEELARAEGKKNSEDLEQSFIKAHFASDPDFKRKPLYINVREPVARYSGVGFVTGLPDLEAHIAAIIMRAEAALALVSGKHSSDLSVETLKSAGSRYRRCIDDAMELAQSLESAHLFISPRNLSDVARYFNSIKGFSERGTFSIAGSVISRTKAGLEPRSVDMTLPKPATVRAALGRLLATLDDRRDEVKTAQAA